MPDRYRRLREQVWQILGELEKTDCKSCRNCIECSNRKTAIKRIGALDDALLQLQLLYAVRKEQEEEGEKNNV